MATPGNPIRWWEQDGDDLAAAILSTLTSLERFEQKRRARYRRNLQLFEGRSITGLHAAAYYDLSESSHEQYDATRVGLARSIVNTGLAKIAGKQRPKTQYVATDADWSAKRQAKKKERAIEAAMLARQGNRQDGWEVALRSYRDCLIGDCGVLNWYADCEEKRVAIDRVIPLEIIIDPLEARNGNPSNLFRLYPYDKDNLAERFPQFRTEILDAPALSEESYGTDLYGTGIEVSRQTLVREAWRLPFSSEKPGWHAITVGGKTLVKEPWTRPFFPFEFFVWEEWFAGMFGTSLVDIVANVHDELNAWAQRRSDAERLSSQATLVYEEGSVNDEALQGNEAVQLVPMKQGSQAAGVAPPTWMPPAEFSQASLSWWQIMKGLGYEMPGMSEQAATGQVPQGMTAAIAMRTHDSISTERHSIQWQQYERVMAIGAARQIIACLRDLEADDPSYWKKWPGGEFLKDIKWDDEDQYHVQPAAVSGLVNTPEDRKQLAQDLYDRQLIGPDAFLRVIQAGDIDREIGKANKQSALIDKWIEQWLDADVDDIREGRFDKFRPPIKWMNLTEGIVQVGAAYMEAEMDDAPPEILDLFIRWLQMADKEDEAKQARAAEMQAAAAGKAAGGVVQGPAGAAPPQAPPGAAPPMGAAA